MSKPILLVEDSPDDVFFMQRALKQAGCTESLHVVEDGQQALDYLAGRRNYADRHSHPLPAIILLDLKLPQVPGLDVLDWIRHEPSVATTPVIVLTSSRADSDIDAAQRRGANAFVVKPTSTQQRLEFAKHFVGFWLCFNEPTRASRATLPSSGATDCTLPSPAA